MALTIPNLCVSRKVFLKHQVNWNTVCGAMQDLPWRNFWSADNPVEVLNEHLLLLVRSFVPTKIIHVRNKDKPWFDDQCRHAFSFKQEAHLRWTRCCGKTIFYVCRLNVNKHNTNFKLVGTYLGRWSFPGGGEPHTAPTARRRPSSTPTASQACKVFISWIKTKWIKKIINFSFVWFFFRYPFIFI